ncbi:hypothetical protein NDU88_001208 [Pleurodeles waltl]|uniref:Uncharacterized protein n=1 Tax=Pleurodeles waltl TaxID=8319 RepID=A0AAV7SYJ7_PLEWA|nr:hypothetical protein NDU88_001208 [Pleurodeles waltl]
MDLTLISERVSELEENETAQDKDVQLLRQEILCLHEQQDALQAQAEDLENRSPRAQTDRYQRIYPSICQSILGWEEVKDLQLDHINRAGQPGGTGSRPPDMLVCVHNFQIKEDILKMASTKQPILFRDHTLSLFQDVSLLTLQHHRQFKPITEFLRSQEVTYDWWHPF